MIENDVNAQLKNIARNKNRTGNYYNSLIKIASEYSDAIIKPKEVMNKPIEKLLSEVSSNSKIFTVDNNDEKIVDSHFKIYNEILS